MTIRTTRKTITFRQPFYLSTTGTIQPSGTYTVDTDEELIDGLSFLAYRRVATLLRLPSTSSRGGMTEIVTVDPSELEVALKNDAQRDGVRE
jgi:hypothetical protein